MHHPIQKPKADATDNRESECAKKQQESPEAGCERFFMDSDQYRSGQCPDRNKPENGKQQQCRNQQRYEQTDAHKDDSLDQDGEQEQIELLIDWWRGLQQLNKYSRQNYGQV